MSTLALSAAPRVLDGGRLGAHLDRLNRAALALTRSRPDADDLVQDVCVNVLAKPRVVHGDDLGYLMRVLRNTFVSSRRRSARRPVETSPVGLERVATRRGDPHQALESREVYAGIAALPTHQRDVLVAVDVLGLSYGEAAERLDVPVGTVMSRLHRARQAATDAIAETARS
jgi:RNA polymerase sigma-70 factor, ECF subfamily